MLMDPKMLSAAIREKKKKLLSEPPEMTGTSPKPDMDAQDVWDMEQTSRIEQTIPMSGVHPSDSDEAMLMDSDHTAGITPEQKRRMVRLRAYLDSMNRI